MRLKAIYRDIDDAWWDRNSGLFLKGLSFSEAALL